MIKRLLNRLSLSRILSILVLYLLLPTTAWGQTTYKGGDYSSNNGSWGDWTVTGTNVGFSSSDGILMCSVPADQTSTIELSLTQTQNTSEKLCALTYSPGTSSYSLLSAKIVNSNDETITDFTTQLKANGGSRFFNAATPIDWGEGKKLVLTCQFVNESNTVANPSISGATVTTGTPYDLIVGGITVTNVNQDNITGKTTWNGSTNVPKIYFTPASTQESMSIPATLYLYEAEIESSDGNSIVSSLSTTLYVNLSGNSTINSGSYLPFENTTGSDADLVFTTAPTGTPGKLTMTSNNAGFSSSSFSTGFHEVLFPQNAGALNAVAGTNGVVEIRQINTYGLSIVGTIVTDTNASNILGTGIEGKVSFNPSTNTLTLDGATINGTIGTSIDGLKIDIKGTNTINAPQDGYAIQSLTDQLCIYFKSSTTPVGSLIMNTSQDSPLSDIYIIYEDNLLTKADYEHYSCIGEDYHITVGDYNVNSVNASNVLRDDFNSVSYNKATSTLSLNNVSIWRISHGAPQALTIEFSGTNTIGSITGYGGNENPLTIIKKNGSSSAFLDVNTEGQSLDDMGPIFHFSSCTWGEGLYLEAYSGETPISGVYYDNGSRRQFKQASGKSISRVVFSGNQPTATPSIWIGGLEPNAEGKFINPDNNTSIQGVTFDKTNNVLTLDEANLSDDIISSLSNLTIKLTGENGERVGRSDLDGNKYIISTNPSATLTFTTDGDNSLWSSKDNYEIPWKGFAGNPTFENKLVFLQAAGTMSIQVLHAPTMGYSSGNLTFSGLSDGYGNGFDCYYSITYEDGNGNIETTKYEPGNGAQPNPVSMEGKPCTVKAYVTYEDRLLNTTKSDIATAYYFGFANDLKVTFDGTEKEIQKSEFPKLIPEVENIDFVLSNSTNTNVIYLENDGGHIKKKGLGTTDLVLNISHNENTQVLNSGGGAVYLTAKVIPSAPTFSVVEGTYDETQTLTLSSSYQKSNSDDQTVVNIKYYTSEDPNKHNPYTDPISIDNTTTITAWVEALITSAAGGTQETITSDTITQEYIIKEEAFIDFMQEENDEYITIEAGQVITGTYGNTIPQVVMPSISDLHGTITFSSSNETVVASSSISLDEENKLKYTVSGAGQTTIQASYTPTEEEPILPTTSSFNLKIEPRAITNATIRMGTNGETSFVYKGTAIEPITSVSLAASETAVAATLNAETDFDLNYYMVSGETETEQEGAPTNVGSYKVTVNAKGNYTGSKSATFTITPATITPKVVITGWAYGATANTPTVSGNTGNGSVTYEYKLQNAEDSKYSTEVPNEAGDYTIKATIAATTNYEAAIDSTHFTISKATPSITFDKESYSATYGAEFTAPTASTNPEGLTVVATASSNTEVATVAENGTVSIVGTGQTTITVSFTGNNNYEAATATYVLNVTACNISNAVVTLSKTSFTYNGTEQKPSVTSITIPATEGDTDSNPITLSETEYEVSGYSEGCTDKGTYTVTVTLKGNYSGTATADFEITARSLTDATIGEITAMTYTGEEMKPTPIVIVKLTESATEATVLKAGTDFTYSYKNNTNVPAEDAANEDLPTVTITGTGNYTGSASTTFTINKAAATITKAPTASTLSFNGELQELITAGECSGGTLQYKLSTDETWSINVPKAKDTGKYTVEYKIMGDQNHLDSETESIEVYINDRTIDPAEDIVFAEGQSYASFYSANEDLTLPESGIAVYMITGIEGNTLITQAVSYIPKGVPVLIEKTETAVEAKDPSEAGTNMLQYATEDVAASATLYILYNGEYVKATGTIPQGKCYLKLNKPSGARALAIGNNNGTTSISNFNADTETDRWFDLNGQRISKPQKKGLYIKNGKKIVVK